ncbi:hypothetical protein GCM10017044_03490 [Kordiimonas sediminis]|uniref:Uncharacterized protein n=1 Tax=Kordiimonas sediminis TaxID=1735581 RepID=A0A919AKC1_9PROT|nr:hypothetical protein [Kordiimonas sediminis]GHF12829.1 hypothetical protein GCM10017044_03490 [Kordiimonas sediminis]
MISSVTATILMALLSQDTGSEQVTPFLPGFPDIPVLECCAEIDPDDRLIFDTPAGTVAETHLTSTDSAEATIKAYDIALTGLGWACSANKKSLTCLRSGYQLSIKTLKNKNNSSILAIESSPVRTP